MSRSPGPRAPTKGLPNTDDAGRPIVAELGRAETPEEVAERKAAASAKRRSNQTATNLVLALLSSLGVVALVVLVVVRPTSIDRDPIDYASVAADAQQSVDVPLVVPVLPPAWTANLAAPFDEHGIVSWQIGLLTPGAQYIRLVQGVDVDERWVSEKTAGAEATGRVTIGDRVWQVYDRRDVQDPGNSAYILTTVSGESTIVLHGTAVDAEFETLAAAVDTELDAEATS